ncbi:peroxiredoxin 1 [Hypoxylon texense]
MKIFVKYSQTPDLTRTRPHTWQESDDIHQASLWYTSDEVKVEDCDAFDDTGECDQRDLVREEESDAGGLCDDCTREHDIDA